MKPLETAAIAEIPPNPTTQQTPCCTHCGLPVPATRIPADLVHGVEIFCCAGCEAVFAIIHKLGLSNYYELRGKLSVAPGNPALVSDDRYDYFDDPLFLDEHVARHQAQTCSLTLLAGGMHCAACVWLLEKLPEILPGVIETVANFESQTIFIRYQGNLVTVSEIARAVNRLGYSPHPRTPDARQKLITEEKRTLAIRIGLAGMSAGNTMLLAISLYQGWFSGIEERYLSFLQWTSLIVSLPAITYSALPFYRSAIAGLKAGIFHIDLPISIGVLGGFTASVVNTIIGSPHIYYDSLCMLVFLLLVGRWLQRAGTDYASRATEMLYSLVPRFAWKFPSSSSEVPEKVFVRSLLPGDRILVNPQEIFPVDGKIISGSSSIDRSILTGESRPVRASMGDKMFAGTKNIENKLELIVEEIESTSRMGKLVQQVESAQSTKAPLVSLTDQISGWFVMVVLLLAVGTASFWVYQGDLTAALDNTLALLVVTCPCALGMSAPVSISVALKKAAANGIFIKRAEAIQLLASAKLVLFDKTGTITQGVPSVLCLDFVDSSEAFESTELYSAVQALESASQHPVALAIRQYLYSLGQRPETDSLQGWSDICILTGQGISGTDLQGLTWHVGSRKWFNSLAIQIEGIANDLGVKIGQGLSPVFVAKNFRLVAVFWIGDKIKPESKAVVSKLNSMNCEAGILSGDLKEIVSSVATTLEIPAYLAHGELSPEDKTTIVKQHSSTAGGERVTLMVGDGVNDAGALAAASVGIAVSGGAELSLKSSDIFMSETSLWAIPELISHSKSTLRTVYRNLSFSLVYNILGAACAVSGYLNPLGAAVLMPLSSLTIIGSSMLLWRRNYFSRV